MALFLAYNVSIDWREEFYMQLNSKVSGQSEMFAHMLAMGYHWQCTHKYTFIDVSTTESDFTIIHLMLFFTSYPY